MKLEPVLVGVLLAASSLPCQVAFAQGRREERSGSQERSHAPSRQAPEFRGHPPGMHPHGPVVRQHPVRVLPQRPARGERREWPHWNHPEMSRPVYYWDWGTVRGVTCVAEDSYGDQYPVTEPAGPGFGPDQMTSVEDAALDRCYAESGQDPSCFLATCSHF